MRAKSRKPVWLINDPTRAASMAAAMREILGPRRLVVFDTWEGAMGQLDKRSPPQSVFIEGMPDTARIAEIAGRLPGVPLFAVAAYAQTEAAATPVAVPEEPPPPGASPGHAYNFTARERQILPLMVRGFIKKEIAEHLSLSFHTVNNHERRIYTKLKIHTRSAAVAKALMERLV